MSTIKFTHLRPLAIFATVVEKGSFAAAARSLMSSRSRISEQVAKLESDLGIRLLQRSTRQLKITDEGKLVYEQASKLPEVLRSVESIVSPATPSGRVAITMPHDIAYRYVAPVLDKFQALYPEIQLDLILNDSLLDLIGEEIDLAIRAGVPKGESLIARVMHEEHLKLFASPEYVAQAGEIKDLNDLAKCHWILLSQVSSNSVQNMRENDRRVEIRPKTFYRCDSPLMLREMVLKGLGIGCLLPNTVKDEVDNNRLVEIMPSLSSMPIVFSLVYPSRRQLPLRTRVLIDYLLEAKIFS